MRMILLLCCALVFSACQAADKSEAVPTATTESAKSKLDEITGTDKEDCDDKAKKVVEIKPEEPIKLGGNTGCTLEE